MIQKVTLHKAEKYAVSKSLSDSVRTFFLKNFGCKRKVYNLYTDYLYDYLEKNNYPSSDIELSSIPIPEVTSFKKAYDYLKEVDSLALANAKISFQNACKKYDNEYDHVSYTKRALKRASSGTEPLSFRGLKGMPKFKAKARGDFSYTTNCQYPSESNSLKRPTIRLEGSVLYLPKLKEGISLIIHRRLPDNAVIGNATVSMDTDGTFFISIGYSYDIEMDITLQEAVLKGDISFIDSLKFGGIDYSQKDFFVNSEGRKANYPHYYRKSEEKLSKLQRELSRMVKDSSNYKKKLSKIQRLHKKIRNQRLDFVNKEAYRTNNEFDVSVVEDIDLRAMGQCLTLGKNLHDNGFGMFRTKLSNKLSQKGSILVKVDRFFPSSKLCHCCGYKNDNLKLSDREWTCPNCNEHLDRDLNAAINIREEGKRIFIDYFRKSLEERELNKQRAEALANARKNRKKKVTSQTTQPDGTPGIDCLISSEN